MSTEFVDELCNRKLWTLRRIGEVINQGRTEGWLRGELVSFDRLEMHAELDRGLTPMRLMQQRLQLTSDESDVLWMLVCIELEPSIARAALPLAFPGMSELSAQTLTMLVGSLVDPFARLIRLDLIDEGDGRTPLFRRSVRVSERVLDLARGVIGLDRTLQAFASLEPFDSAKFEVAVPVDVSRLIATREPCLIAVSGPRGSGRATLLRAACAENEQVIVRVEAGRLGEGPLLERQLAAIARECLLHDASPLIENVDQLGERQVSIDRCLCSVLERPVLVTSHEPPTWSTRTLVNVEAEPLDLHARSALWSAALGTAPPDVIENAAQYNLVPALILKTAESVRARRGRKSVSNDDVRTALRQQLEQRFGRLARRVKTQQRWSDLVLPVDQLELLLELVARVKHRSLVLDDWGFGAKVGKGNGVSVLMSGPPGTGKTMIGGLLADELGRDLYQIDLSQVMSKYIGETEKQLAGLFDAAEAGHAILLFDEADSLFAKRTDVKSSNDRYANLEVNYLLQRVEAFTGICLLTTNHEQSLDPAFQRRITAHIRVPMPDRDHRERLWRALIPAAAEVATDLDFHALAEFQMSGGYIKNAVVRGAYLAASDQTAITNAHLWRAARLEYEASGKLMAEIR